MKKLGAILVTLALVLGSWSMRPLPAQAAPLVEEEPIVIVLDAGHGGSDGGATRTWGGRKYKEKTLNLKIARYCREELEQYAGVEVYMTRTGDNYVTLGGRVLFAEELDADLFVSLHNNADTKISSRGACVFYPNRYYGKQIGETGMGAAACIQKRLVALGIKNNGIAYRNSENKTKYPNKKLADYYFVIREGKKAGIPAIIVEHAYVSNPTDCKMFLSTDAKLKRLGVADAVGIADYYGLVKGEDAELLAAESQPDGSVVLEWEEAEGMDGYSVYRRLLEDEEFERIATVEGTDTTSYTDNAASAAGTYEYSVRAYVTNQNVSRYTAYSDILEAVRIPAPVFFTWERTEDGKMRLVWSPVDGASGYVIARRENSAESFVTVAQLEGEELSEWVDDAASGEAAYEYRLCAYLDGEEGPIMGPYFESSEQNEGD